jgi:hypothetical protein
MVIFNGFWKFEVAVGRAAGFGDWLMEIAWRCLEGLSWKFVLRMLSGVWQLIETVVGFYIAVDVNVES